MRGQQDFDFLFGRWTVRHRRLRARGSGCRDWEEFDGTAETRPLLGGLCDIEEHQIPDQDFSGVALRTFEPAKELWSIYWVSARDGLLQRPVIGRFEGDIGRFEGDDADGDRPVKVHFLWQRGGDLPRWEQSFSYDSGETWELNWVMVFQRPSH
ncbi:MAG TPA: DUF1579 domain-containing protein [Sphingomicrobium sp.]|nr:DUF1579 domain-containing protein [Sphingomicrobium sp.]